MPKGIYPRRQRTVEEERSRLLAKSVLQENGCRRFGKYIAPNGYGKISFQGKGDYAHRVSYILFVGPIPEGLEPDHKCRNRACINPDHLEAVTRRVNLLRGETLAAAMATKTYCDSGHAFTEANTYMWNSTRNCRECRKLYQRELRSRRRENA